jgi:hypothetical protein
LRDDLSEVVDLVQKLVDLSNRELTEIFDLCSQNAISITEKLKKLQTSTNLVTSRVLQRLNASINKLKEIILDDYPIRESYLERDTLSALPSYEDRSPLSQTPIQVTRTSSAIFPTSPKPPPRHISSFPLSPRSSAFRSKPAGQEEGKVLKRVGFFTASEIPSCTNT